MENIVLKINNIEDLDEVLRVSEEVFEPDKQEKEKYHNKSDWLLKIKDGLLVSAAFDKKIVGFAVCYQKENRLHIWNVGVLGDYRKMGVWRKMYEEIIRYAKNNNYPEVSLNTYKEKFPAMYGFCVKEGFAEYDTEFDFLTGKIKSKFSKKL